MASQYTTSSSQLNPRPTPPSYGSFLAGLSGTSTPSTSQSPPPYIPPHSAPESAPSQSLPPGKSSARLKAVCLLSLLLLSCAIVLRSNALTDFIKFERRANRAASKSSTLVAERQKWELEKENMRHDRAMWEKVPDDHIPPGAIWSNIQGGLCRAYGKQEYQGVLKNIPVDWNAMDACMKKPASIKARHPAHTVEIGRPYRCEFVSYFGDIHGYWIVEDEACKPKLGAIHDTGCTNYGSGLTRLEAEVSTIHKKEQEWRVLCESLPFTWDGIDYTSPIRCEERVDLGTKVAVWEVPAESCR